MSKGFYKAPALYNEPTLSYAPGTPERKLLKEAIADLRSRQIEVPMFIGGEKVRTGELIPMNPPHDHRHVLGYYHKGTGEHVMQAIDAALATRPKWQALTWDQRAAIFLKAADLVSGPYRAKLNAASMLGQSKNANQAEIDAACETADFLRFNVHYMMGIYQDQPVSSHGVWNKMEWRPLEGVVYAITPFNFTSIAANLPAAPALMGNVVVWKPAGTQVYSANVLMEIFHEAGMPDGVINMIMVDGPVGGKIMATHPEFVGVHFTGSSEVFNKVWKAIGENVALHNTFPKIVGETGGKDFVMVHPSANIKPVVTALTRSAFEYQGQKCSAASRAYIPRSLWPEIKSLMLDDIRSFRMGGVEDFRNFINAVIDENAFDKLAGFIDRAKKDPDAEIIAGGGYDKSVGYFIEPTVILTKNPKYVTMCEELFGPVLTVYVYEDDQYEETLDILDKTSPYALTGSIFAQDRYIIDMTAKKLVNAAGNFYINDKPTGAVVGQQPFGGARASGTNDKSGSYLNLIRWVSPRTIKENFNPPVDYRYPFMDEE
ncbi:MAG: L-glutamate gamma-semialdehyde dehydrogenase [Bacteroidales bacterium]|nr:L-glutamate gamma-semialdehyde dehydrogenase [Bacteroidales bacterium]